MPLSWATFYSVFAMAADDKTQDPTIPYDEIDESSLDEEEYEVEAIVGHRKKRGKVRSLNFSFFFFS